MDDTELGRPPRHARPKKKSEPKTMAPPSAGEGGTITIDETRSCAGCDTAIRVRYEGPADSFAARLAAMRLGGVELLCESCGDERERMEAESERQAQVTAEIRRRLSGSGIPERWRTLTFDRLDRDAARAEAFDVATTWGRGLRGRGVLLWGDVGRGKTMLAAAAAVERCAVGPVRWLSVAELLLDLRMPFDAPEYEGAVRKLKPHGRPALVLDDLDKLKPSEHALQPLYVAINGWIEAGLPMMVTLNRSVDELAGWAGETFGAALASRLAGYCDVIEVRGRDRRLS